MVADQATRRVNAGFQEHVIQRRDTFGLEFTTLLRIGEPQILPCFIAARMTNDASSW